MHSESYTIFIKNFLKINEYIIVYLYDIHFEVYLCDIYNFLVDSKFSTTTKNTGVNVDINRSEDFYFMKYQIHVLCVLRAFIF